VPQVVIPCWLDTLEFANRVEWLGIGVYGSRSATPSVEGQELSQALLKVLGDGVEATQTKEKAKQLAAVSGKVGGRKAAFDKIIEILESS
jgi:UDP:flavonoid glycosyltransferase YjiC (YdhE family)